MITFQLEILNPLWDKRFANLYCSAGSTFVPNKYWELEILKSNELIGFNFSITSRQDHAGLAVTVAVLGYSINFKLYDHRHWDYEINNWIDYEKLAEK